MNKLFYPAVFHEAEEGGFWVTFPDFPGVLTQGNILEESYDMSMDALGLELESMEKEGLDHPLASKPSDIVTKAGDVIVLIEFDMLEYKRRTNSKAVKKTVSIPGWLNEIATEKGLNFSAILQKGLKEALNIF